MNQQSYPNARSGSVTTVGVTATPLSAVSVPCRKIEIQLLPTGIGNIAVGGSECNAVAGAEIGLQSPVGNIVTIYAENLNEIFVASSTPTQKVLYNYYF